MKRVLIITILLTIVIVGYRSPFVQQWAADGSKFVQTKTQGFGAEFTISEQDMFAELGEALANFSEQEKIYIGKISRSEGELRRFNSSYCINKDYNPILFEQHLTLVCASTQNLLSRI